MKGYRFYLEFPSVTARNKATRKNPVGHTGNVFAYYTDILPYSGSNGGVMYEGAVALYDRPDSPVITGSVERDWLKQTIRISEAEARKIHPTLISYLEYADRHSAPAKKTKV